MIAAGTKLGPYEVVSLLERGLLLLVPTAPESEHVPGCASEPASPVEPVTQLLAAASK